MSDIVDLTLSDAEEEQVSWRQAKRQRTAGGSSGILGADEVEVVEEVAQQEQQQQLQRALGEDEDLRVVEERGEGALPLPSQHAVATVLGKCRGQGLLLRLLSRHIVFSCVRGGTSPLQVAQGRVEPPRATRVLRCVLHPPRVTHPTLLQCGTKTCRTRETSVARLPFRRGSTPPMYNSATR